MIDWKRILRTAIQSGCGAGIAFITAVASDYSKEALIASAIQLVSTVAIAVLMNIKSQTEDNEER